MKTNWADTFSWLFLGGFVGAWVSAKFSDFPWYERMGISFGIILVWAIIRSILIIIETKHKNIY